LLKGWAVLFSDLRILYIVLVHFCFFMGYGLSFTQPTAATS